MYNECNFIRFSPEGREIFFGSAAVRQALRFFTAYPRPENSLGGRFLGAGRYSSVQMIGGIVMKASTPTSSRDAYESGRPVPPEDLVKQFTFLNELRDYLDRTDSGITAPKQYFVAHSASGNYLLGQEWMEGWQTFAEWADMEYSKDEKKECGEMVEATKARIKAAVAERALLEGLNDLHLDKEGKINGGNLLVPVGAQRDEILPLCIIDQPLYREKP